MVATVAAGTVAEYYTAQSEYYLGSKEPAGIWLSVGPGIDVSIGTAVDADTFVRLHAGEDRSGNSLVSNDGGRSDAVGGYDICMSVPKAVSVLFGLADADLRIAIEHAQVNAVQAALSLLDRHAAFCRRGHGGQILERVTLTVATFQHGESRPTEHADGFVFSSVNLHSHACALSIAQRADGSFGRLDGRPLFRFKMAAGAEYHRVLAGELRKLGFATKIAGKNGIFEIAGVDPELCKYFSPRREEIVAAVAKHGLTTSEAPALAAATARATRSSKSNAVGDDRHVVWRDRAAALGFAADHVIRQARDAGRDRSPLLASPALIEERLTAVLDDLTERRSVVQFRNLLAAVASAFVDLDDVPPVESVVSDLLARGQIVSLASDRWGHALVSTPAVIALEQSLRDVARRLADLKQKSPEARQVDAAVRRADLNTEQEAAARVACEPRTIVIIEGGPGVGKTTLLKPVAEAWQAAGWTVIGAATAWKIAHQLHDDLRIESRAVDSWLARADAGHGFLQDRTVLLLDEAGLLSSKQMHRILDQVEQANREGRRVALRMVGDRKQIQAMGSPGLRIVADTIGTRRVDTIVRQREQWSRDAVTAFGNGDASEALDQISAHGHLHALDGETATIRAMVEAWDNQRRLIDDILLIAKTNRQILAINKAARTRLRSAGDIALSDGAVLAAVTPSGQKHDLPIAKGDLIRFLARADALGVINGTTGEVLDVRGEDEALRLTVRIGERVVDVRPYDLADDKGRVRLAHAYATTCYGSQGLTTESAFVLADPAMDRHDIFVAASRARGETHLFYDGKALDARAKGERLLTDRGRPSTPIERLDVLAAALSRSGAKATTLDYLDARRPEPEPEPDPDTTPQTEQTQRRQRTKGVSLD